jgi:hypothetical protein
MEALIRRRNKNNNYVITSKRCLTYPNQCPPKPVRGQVFIRESSSRPYAQYLLFQVSLPIQSLRTGMMYLRLHEISGARYGLGVTVRRAPNRERESNRSLSVGTWCGGASRKPDRSGVHPLSLRLLPKLRFLP